MRLKTKKKRTFFRRVASLLLAAAIVAGSATYALADDAADPADPNEPQLQSVLTAGGSGTDTLCKTIKSIDGNGYVAVGYTASKDGDLAGLHSTTGTTGMLAFINADINGNPTSLNKVLTFGGDRSATYSATTYLYSIAAVSDGYVIVGSTMSNKITDSYGDESGYHSGTDAILMKVDTSGNLEWVKYWGGSGTDEFKDVVVVGRTIIAIGDTHSANGDISTLKGSEDGIAVAYELDGTKLWQTQIGGTSTAHTTVAQNSVTADAKGNIYIAGSAFQQSSIEGTGDFATATNGGEALGQCMVPFAASGGSTQFPVDGFVAKLDSSNGTIQWIQAADNLPYNSIILNSEENLVLTGTTYADTTYGNGYGAIASMDANGKIVSTQLFSGNVGLWYGGNTNMDDTTMAEYDALLLSSAAEMPDGTYVAVGATFACQSPDTTDTRAQNSEYDFSGKNHTIASLNSQAQVVKKTDVILMKFDLSGHVYWIQNMGSSIGTPEMSDTAQSVFAISDGGYVVSGISGAQDGDFSTSKYSQDFYFAKFSSDIDTDGDGVPNNRDAYPDDATKSVDTAATYDYTAVPKLTFTGTGSAGAKWGDLYSYLLPMKTRAQSIFKATDNVLFNIGAAKVTAPFAALDAAIGTDKADALTFTYGSATVSNTETTTYASPFTLGTTLGGTAVTKLAAKVRVTVPASNIDLSKLSGLYGTVKLGLVSDPSATVSATADTANNTLTFDTDTPAGTFALSAPAARVTVDSYTTAQTNQPVTVTAHAADGTFADGSTTATHTFESNDSYTFEAANALGVTASKTVTISNIKTTGPTVTLGSYDGTTPTNKDITVTAATDDDATLNVTSHTFTENGSFDFVATDTAGNKTTKTVTITNIDKIAPTITLGSHDGTTPTNKDVTVTAATDNDATLDYTSHTFTENGTFTFTATDKAGNTVSKTVTISNIDKTPPAVTIGSYDTSPTFKSVTVTATTDSDATLNGASHTFTKNGSFDFVATDAAGNVTTKTVTVSNIITSLSGITSDGSVAVDAPVASLPDGVTGISVRETPAASGSATYSTVQTALDNQGYNNTIAVNDIELLDENGQLITGLKDDVTVKIKIPDGATGDLKVLWYNPADSTATDMHATQQDGYLVFQTNHFSYYVVATAKDASPTASSEDTTPSSTTAASSETANPATGENPADPRAALYALLAAAAAAGVLAFRRGRARRG